MINKRMVLVASLLTSLCFIELDAQNVNPASGGNAIGSGGTVSYSVGQTVYTSTIGSNGSAAQGVQQPYEISILTEIEEAKEISLDFVVYPNPSTDYIRLSVKNLEIENLSYRLFTFNGSLLEHDKIQSTETNITMGNLNAGTYFLKIIQGNKLLKTFKIIKN